MAEALPAEDVTETRPEWTDFLSGIFLGLLVGGIVGLSVSDLAGDVIAGLVAMLAAYFGLGGKLPAGAAVTRIRLLAFSIGVLVGVPGAILVRTNGWLAPSLEHRVEGYESAGIPESLARELAIFDQTGLRIGSLSSAPDPTPVTTNNPVAFNAVSAAQCSSLLRSAHATPQLRLQAMEKTRAPWGQAGQFGLALPQNVQADFAEYVHDVFCGSSE